MNDYPQHCAECGAYLATGTDITKHASWHEWINQRIGEAIRLADHADMFHRPLGGPRA